MYNTPVPDLSMLAWCCRQICCISLMYVIQPDNKCNEGSRRIRHLFYFCPTIPKMFYDRFANLVNDPSLSKIQYNSNYIHFLWPCARSLSVHALAGRTGSFQLSRFRFLNFWQRNLAGKRTVKFFSTVHMYFSLPTVYTVQYMIYVSKVL